jgi:8-oxo-dGTP diphosphatase
MKELRVAVGIIRDQQNAIFLTQRSANVPMANKWEFPGGKLEQGETAEQALYRELLEEIGIKVISAKKILETNDHQPELCINLSFFLVEDWDGEPWGKEGQPCRWVPQQQLIIDEFPIANRAMVMQLVQGLV